MPELKLFTEKSDESFTTTPILLESIKLPPYTRPIFNRIDDILKKLGYDNTTEKRGRRSDKKFIIDSGYGYSTWYSREINVSGGLHPEIYLSIYTSERRKSEALQIAKEIENQLTEDVKKYLEELKDKDFTKRAKKSIPTLRD